MPVTRTPCRLCTSPGSTPAQRKACRAAGCKVQKRATGPIGRTDTVARQRKTRKQRERRQQERERKAAEKGGNPQVTPAGKDPQAPGESTMDPTVATTVEKVEETEPEEP